MIEIRRHGRGKALRQIGLENIARENPFNDLSNGLFIRLAAEIAGPAFLLLTKEDLKNYGLNGGPSSIIINFINNLKREEQTSSIQEIQKQERLKVLEDKIESLQELFQKSGE